MDSVNTVSAKLVAPIVWLLLCLCCAPIAAQEDDGEYSPGLIAEYRSGQSTATRVDRRVAFRSTQVLDRRLTSGKITARWKGYLMSQSPGKYRFYLHAAGQFTLKIGKRSLIKGTSTKEQWFSSPEVELPFDFHPLELTYRQTGAVARLALFWSGPKFQLEPVSERQLMHRPQETPKSHFQQGESLVHGLRCSACHKIPGEPGELAAPSLRHFSFNIRPQWLVKRLTSPTSTSGKMPHFRLNKRQAESIVAFLTAQSKRPKVPSLAKPKLGKRPEAADRITAANGERLFVTMGCLACHTRGKLGNSNEFGGGDLSAVAGKRPPHFFEQWLANPQRLNSDHRMPVFRLSAIERSQLAKYLQTLGKPAGPEKSLIIPTARSRIKEGQSSFVDHGCHSCHQVNLRVEPRARTSIRGKSNWSRGCLKPPAGKRPGYRLSDQDNRAIKAFVAGAVEQKAAHTSVRVLRELNCLACHSRDHNQGIATQLPALGTAHRSLASILPALKAPTLTGVGDKLMDSALADAIRSKEPRRPWLRIRMPRFRLPKDRERQLVQHFVAADRVPAGQVQLAKEPSPRDMKIAGRRLVTTAGFGCTSCHQVGKVLPPKAQLNALGPTLSLLGKRIRRSWYERWVRNPARMVPRMEMPSLQLAVKGVLANRLDHQISAVWHVLNEPGFEPPMPNPVRVVRRSNLDARGRAVVLTDVLLHNNKQLIKPMLIGLPNRHNVLLDWSVPGMVSWWIGDVAHQRTKGKTWFWVSAGNRLLQVSKPLPGIQLKVQGRWVDPDLRGQFPTELELLRHIPGGVELTHKLRFGKRLVTVRQTLIAIKRVRESGFFREVIVDGAEETPWRLLVLPGDQVGSVRDRQVKLAKDPDSRVQIVTKQRVTTSKDGLHVIATGAADESDRVRVDYLTRVVVDEFPPVAKAAEKTPLKPVKLAVVPGYQAIRLPFADSLMPTGLAWRKDGTLFITSLKGRVWSARDTNNDGLEDHLQPFGDELAAPFGIAAYDGYVDVINKSALLRMFDEDGDGRCEKVVRLASGWGHTADYHDWTVGLPRDRHGNYFLAISCQQDNRSPAAAHLRGTIVRLRPTTRSGPFKVEYWTGGHRFPIGLAMNRAGQLFVSDNQGNYNPFNELNHVQRGKRYGFINTLERKAGFNPPLTPPAIDIPHPWTRSVNGICFLETPDPVLQKSGARFGPFEGHLIGCEYDTRRLVRMSLERVGGQYQGAAYPFSYDRPRQGQPLLGPLVCQVSPQGDLYVGCIRDSGWGGANNIGTVVKLTPQKLPAGIAEVKATRTGLIVRFTRPVSADKANATSSYSVSSYTRVSTPSYGGRDRNRRVEKIRSVKLNGNATEASIDLGRLRKGYVYELRMKNVAVRGDFFPAEAYYTMRNIP